MEPHWNPMVEEQALARIHRIGQTKEVMTIRYVMKDSLEEVISTSASNHQRLIFIARHKSSESEEAVGGSCAITEEGI
jgi:SWI/SNF-related matrix-associated actin-dependent regulator of chromatin subfamily A3